jgi:hypothetical protein
MDERELIARAREGDRVRPMLYWTAQTDSTRTWRQREPILGGHSEDLCFHIHDQGPHGEPDAHPSKSWSCCSFSAYGY